MIYRAFPIKKNKILVRMENMADKFDSRSAFVNRFINIKKFANDFYAEAN